jgi:hypothetical protein
VPKGAIPFGQNAAVYSPFHDSSMSEAPPSRQFDLKVFPQNQCFWRQRLNQILAGHQIVIQELANRSRASPIRFRSYDALDEEAFAVLEVFLSAGPGTSV